MLTATPVMRSPQTEHVTHPGPVAPGNLQFVAASADNWPCALRPTVPGVDNWLTAYVALARRSAPGALGRTLRRPAGVVELSPECLRQPLGPSADEVAKVSDVELDERPGHLGYVRP